MRHGSETLVQEMFAAYARADSAALRRLLAPDVEYLLPGRSPMAGVYRGPDEVLALWERQKTYLGGAVYRVTPETTVADDDELAIVVAGVAEGPTGVLRWRAVNVYRVQGGRIASCQVFVNDLYSFDAFWAGMPTRPVTQAEVVGGQQSIAEA